MRKYHYKMMEKEENDKKLLKMSDEGNLNEVKTLLSGGGWVDVNFADVWTQYTPLMNATYFNHKDLVKFLLVNGAEVNRMNQYGCSELHIISLRSALGQYRVSESVDLAKLLLSRKADPNKKNGQGNTPLHLAAYYGRKVLAKALLDGGADLSVENNGGGDTVTFGFTYGTSGCGSSSH